jgi:peptidase E
LEEVKNGFISGSHNLFDFVINYHFAKNVSFDERVTIYCQLVSQYENVFEITEQFAEKEEIEFAMIYPK